MLKHTLTILGRKFGHNFVHLIPDAAGVVEGCQGVEVVELIHEVFSESLPCMIFSCPVGTTSSPSVISSS